MSGSQFGFTLGGGAEVGTRVFIQSVEDDTSKKFDLRVNDVLLYINMRDLTDGTKSNVEALLARSGKTVDLTIERGMVNLCRRSSLL